MVAVDMAAVDRSGRGRAWEHHVGQCARRTAASHRREHPVVVPLGCVAPPAARLAATRRPGSEAPGEVFVLGGHVVPRVVLGHTALERGAEALGDVGVPFDGHERVRECRLAVEEDAGRAEHLAVEPHVERDGGGAGAHRTEQRRVGPADRVAVHVAERVGVELVEQVLVPHGTEQPDPSIGVGDLADDPVILVGVRRRADDHERQSGAARSVPAGDHVDVVLGLEPGHGDVVAAAAEVELGQPVVGQVLEHRSAVGDLLRRCAELVAVVRRDAGRVGDQRVGPSHTERLRGAVVAAAAAAPLRAPPLEAVDVEGDGHAAGAEDGDEG